MPRETPTRYHTCQKCRSRFLGLVRVDTVRRGIDVTWAVASSDSLDMLFARLGPMSILLMGRASLTYALILQSLAVGGRTRSTHQCHWGDPYPLQTNRQQRLRGFLLAKAGP